MSGCVGKLYGVGLGPGDPDLVTLKALKVMQQARLVGYFRKKGALGHAFTIARGHLSAEAELVPLEYPVTTETHFESADYVTAISRFYADTAATIANNLEQGRDFTLLCEGDPFFYGSFLHMYERLRERFQVEVIPGITGMSGCWTAAATPMTLGDDVLSVLPGTLEASCLIEKLRQCDAAVIMKVGCNLGKIRAALHEAGRFEDAVYVERGTMSGQRVARLAEVGQDKAPYFSIILVPGCRGRRVL